MFSGCYSMHSEISNTAVLANAKALCPAAVNVTAHLKPACCHRFIFRGTVTRLDCYILGEGRLVIKQYIRHNMVIVFLCRIMIKEMRCCALGLLEVLDCCTSCS